MCIAVASSVSLHSRSQKIERRFVTDVGYVHRTVGTTAASRRNSRRSTTVRPMLTADIGDAWLTVPRAVIIIHLTYIEKCRQLSVMSVTVRQACDGVLLCQLASDVKLRLHTP